LNGSFVDGTEWRMFPPLTDVDHKNKDLSFFGGEWENEDDTVSDNQSKLCIKLPWY
jgi:hypothetical protein